MPSETHLLAAWRILAKIVGADWTVGKAIGGLAAMIASLFATTDTTRITLLVLGIAVALDFVSGVRAAHNRGEFSRSRLFGRLIDKGVVYVSLAALAITLPKAFHDAAGSMVGIAANVVLGLAVAVETASVLENLGKLGFGPAKTLAKLIRLEIDEKLDQITPKRDNP